MHDIWNTWHGCKKVSQGCQHCYMYFLDKSRNITDSNVIKPTKQLEKPPVLARDRHKNYKIKSGERIRVNMTSDTFIAEADPWRGSMWETIRKRPDVIFWLLTKRPARIKDNLPADWGNGYDNVALNITCENQEMFDIRWPFFKKVPAKHKGLCLAPLLSPINIEPALMSGQIGLVECGGENYENPRPIDIAWVEDLSNQCSNYGINFCWYESGTRVITPAKEWFIPSKARQAEFAYLSGLNRKFYDEKYILRDPETNEVLEEISHKKLYNKYHCAFCSGRLTCNGCAACSNCSKCERVTLEEILKMEKDILNT